MPMRSRSTGLRPTALVLFASTAGCVQIIAAPLFIADATDKAIASKERWLYRVIDAETLAPVAGAMVEQSTDFGILGPLLVAGRTDRDGYVVLRPARHPGPPNAHGPDHRGLSGHDPVEADAPRYASLAGPRVGDPDGVVVLTTWTIRAVPPRTLVLPSGFRGTVRIRWEPDNKPDLPPLGTRRSPPMDQVVNVDVRPGAVTRSRIDFPIPGEAGHDTARFEDGTPIWRATSYTPATNVAAWWVATDRETPTSGALVYAIGTRDDAARTAATTHPQRASPAN